MNGNLISSSTDTDLRIGVVAALGLAIIVTVASILDREARTPSEPRGTITLSATAPEIVRPAPKVMVQHQDAAARTIQ